MHETCRAWTELILRVRVQFALDGGRVQPVAGKSAAASQAAQLQDSLPESGRVQPVVGKPTSHAARLQGSPAAQPKPNVNPKAAVATPAAAKWHSVGDT